MTKKIYSVPQLQKITTTADPDEFDLVMADEHSGGSAMNMYPLVLEFDLHLGSAEVNLPAISGFLAGKSAGIGFMIHAGIVNNAPAKNVTFYPYDEEDETNTICGYSSMAELSGVGAAGKLWIAGKTIWGFSYCIVK